MQLSLFVVLSAEMKIKIPIFLQFIELIKFGEKNTRWKGKNNKIRMQYKKGERERERESIVKE